MRSIIEYNILKYNWLQSNRILDLVLTKIWMWLLLQRYDDIETVI